MQQEIRFCVTPDGINLAYAKSGSGYPVVRVGTFLTHLEHDWQSPIWRPWLDNFSRFHSLYRYDVRGCGLSDREVENISLETLLSDIETVVDAAGLERFALFGMSQGAAAAIWYAVHNPERVSHVIVYGGYLYGSGHLDLNSSKYADHLLSNQIFKLGWATDNPAYQRMFPIKLLPDGTTEQIKWMSDLQRSCTNGDNAVRIREAYGQIDIRPITSMLSTPILILHARDDKTVSFEHGRELATQVSNARFVPLESNNHILLPSEPAWLQFWENCYDFLGIKDKQYESSLQQNARLSKISRFADLTIREREVMELLARGYRNDVIAESLFLSSKTVRNYVSRIFSKLHISNRGEAIVLGREGGFGDDSPQ